MHAGSSTLLQEADFGHSVAPDGGHAGHYELVAIELISSGAGAPCAVGARPPQPVPEIVQFIAHAWQATDPPPKVPSSIRFVVSGKR
jgi:hypothetical protein